MSTIIDLMHLIFPVALAGIAHMLIVKYEIFYFLKIPISIHLFGKNKTWRGIVMLPLLMVAILHLATLVITSPLSELRGGELTLLGFLLGFGYILFELPNSFIKRRLQIPEGKQSPVCPSIFSFIDQADSVLGCVIDYSLFLPYSLNFWFGAFLIGTLMHLILNYVTFLLKIRHEKY
ncbi:MAG: CDP-archaeol synthase [Bacteriovoracales bacterium]